MTHSRRYLLFAVLICLASLSIAEEKKIAPASAPVTGRYDGTAKNKAEDVITVSINLTEKDGALSGIINSSHGDFTITGGSHKGEAVTIEFDAGGPGTLSLRMDNDRLVGTWTAGEDGGVVDVKRVAAKEDVPKGKS